MNEKAHKGIKQEHGSRAFDARTVFLFLLFAFAMLLFMAIVWPAIYDTLRSGAPERIVVTSLGTVKRIHYIGGIGTDTQIDLEEHTVLVMGSAILDAGTALELRSRGKWSEVCVASTSRCWERLGH